MDDATRAIVDFARGLTLADLTPSALDAAKVRILDAYACAWGATEADTVVAAKRAFLPRDSVGPAHLITGEAGPADVCAFINSLMTRYLDFNDAHEVAYGHPSDMVLPIINVAEAEGATGADALLAVVAAYQVACGITLGGGTHYKRWETAFAQGMGTAVAAGMLMGLDTERMADAVGISVAMTSPLNIRKTGSHLSMWKGAAGPQASRMGIHAAELARAGMGGPHESFAGARGVFEMVTGPLDMARYVQTNDGFQVEQTTIKLWPISGRALGPVQAALELRGEIDDVGAIESIDIQTYKYCYDKRPAPARPSVKLGSKRA